jgi:hypothetical protein
MMLILVNVKNNMFCENTYLASVEKAKSLGYKEYLDSKAYLGKSYRKNGKKWIIFSPSHLLEDPEIKAKNIKDEEGLERLGYNIKDYYDHHPDSLAYRADLYRIEAEQIFYETERMQNIQEIFGYANIDFDDVDNINETLNQIGYNSFFLKKDKDDNSDDEINELYLEINNENQFHNSSLNQKILAWHCDDEKKKMPHIYKK